MNIFGTNFDHFKNNKNGEVKETSYNSNGNKPLELKGKMQFSKAYINKTMKSENESIAERILKNRTRIL